jgi:hypothetical protein
MGGLGLGLYLQEGLRTMEDTLYQKQDNDSVWDTVDVQQVARILEALIREFGLLTARLISANDRHL